MHVKQVDSFQAHTVIIRHFDRIDKTMSHQCEGIIFGQEIQVF